MDFKLVRYYDTCCEECGNWATTDICAAELSPNKKDAEKILLRYGWKVVDGKVLCNYCLEGTSRSIQPAYNNSI